MAKAQNKEKVPGSFRDPDGFVFSQDGEIYRQINLKGKINFDLLHSSGLYQALVFKNWLISHAVVSEFSSNDQDYYKIIKPEGLLFVSHPYEWSFSQLKDAALLTLDIQKEAILHGMSLKDASAYNIQFNIASGKALFIDTLSFEKFVENKTWSAYGQFCQHFLAPLALMAYSDIRFGQFLRFHIEGFPLDLAWKLLPKSAYLHSGLFTHIYLHSKAQLVFADSKVRSARSRNRMTNNQHLGILDSLRRSISKLRYMKNSTEWENYYEDTNYSETAFNHKKTLVSKFISRSNPNFVWDLGGNTGEFSRLASNLGIPTISFDIDPNAIEKNYLISKKTNNPNIVPLILDLNNPSPDLGWNNEERPSIFNRKSPDTVLALALIHHLAISNNLPLNYLAQFFSRISPWLIIEFVPKNDSQVQRLFYSREDIFPNYSVEGFEAAFNSHFSVIEKASIQDSERTLFLMKRLRP